MVLVRYISATASTQTLSPQTTFKVYFTLMPFLHHHISHFHIYYTTLGYKHFIRDIVLWTNYTTHGHGLQQNKTTRRDAWFSQRWV